jgi:hypothetical protein
MASPSNTIIIADDEELPSLELGSSRIFGHVLQYLHSGPKISHLYFVCHGGDRCGGSLE